MKKYYTVKQVGYILQVSTRTIYNLIKQGRLKSYKKEKEWRIEENELKHFIHTNY